jgi:hypothetical protein
VTLLHTALSEENIMRNCLGIIYFYKLVFKEADNYIKYFNVLNGRQDAKSHGIKYYET